MYTVENFKSGSGRLYSGIRDFLREAADKGFNEHFHSGRFEWMMAHPFLDVGMLSKIAAFRDENNRIVGAALFDTSFEDKWYLPHIDDDALLDDGEPEKMSGDAEKRLGDPRYIKVFAVTDSGYAAHCGVWYDSGDTAYIEPVATVPEHRRKGLGRAVVYEAARRAKERGAKRAIVLSDNEFYFRIGMTVSSEIATWTRK